MGSLTMELSSKLYTIIITIVYANTCWFLTRKKSQIKIHYWVPRLAHDRVLEMEMCLYKQYEYGMDMRGWGNERVKEGTEIIYFYLHLVHVELETPGINANFLPDMWNWTILCSDLVFSAWFQILRTAISGYDWNTELFCLLIFRQSKFTVIALYGFVCSRAKVCKICGKLEKEGKISCQNSLICLIR